MFSIPFLSLATVTKWESLSKRPSENSTFHSESLSRAIITIVQYVTHLLLLVQYSRYIAMDAVTIFNIYNRKRFGGLFFRRISIRFFGINVEFFFCDGLVVLMCHRDIYKVIKVYAFICDACLRKLAKYFYNESSEIV